MRRLVFGEGDAGHFVPGSSSVQVPRRSQVSDADVSNRVLAFTFETVAAGAIHSVDIDGFVSITGLV